MSWYETYDGRATYRVHEQTGHVVAYGPESDGPRPGLWIASHWEKHPLDHEDAVHIEHLAADSPVSDLNRALRAWAEEQDAQYARDSA